MSARFLFFPSFENWFCKSLRIYGDRFGILELCLHRERRQRVKNSFRNIRISSLAQLLEKLLDQMELLYETLIGKYLSSWILPSSWDLNFKQTISRINSDSYQILRMEYPDMEFPVFFYQTNQIPTFLLFLPGPAECFHIKRGQICMKGVISPPTNWNRINVYPTQFL